MTPPAQDIPASNHDARSARLAELELLRSKKLAKTLHGKYTSAEEAATAAALEEEKTKNALSPLNREFKASGGGYSMFDNFLITNSRQSKEAEMAKRRDAQEFLSSYKSVVGVKRDSQYEKLNEMDEEGGENNNSVAENLDAELKENVVVSETHEEALLLDEYQFPDASEEIMDDDIDAFSLEADGDDVDVDPEVEENVTEKYSQDEESKENVNSKEIQIQEKLGFMKLEERINNIDSEKSTAWPADSHITLDGYELNDNNMKGEVEKHTSQSEKEIEVPVKAKNEKLHEPKEIAEPQITPLPLAPPKKVKRRNSKSSVEKKIKFNMGVVHDTELDLKESILPSLIERLNTSIVTVIGGGSASGNIEIVRPIHVAKIEKDESFNPPEGESSKVRSLVTFNLILIPKKLEFKVVKKNVVDFLRNVLKKEPFHILEATYRPRHELRKTRN